MTLSEDSGVDSSEKSDAVVSEPMPRQLTSAPPDKTSKGRFFEGLFKRIRKHDKIPHIEENVQDSPSEESPTPSTPVPILTMPRSRIQIVEEAMVNVDGVESGLDSAKPLKKHKIKTLIKGFFTTRKKSKPPAESVNGNGPVITKRTYVERKFSPSVVSPPPVDPAPDIISDVRTKPLPPVKLARKKTFWGMIKELLFGKLGKVWPFSTLADRFRGRVRTLQTGLTPRQRIKRYNAIHEGGYGMEDVVGESDSIGGDDDDNTPETQ